MATTLPKKYGVCRGYIVDSWKNLSKPTRYHYDVIIYDALEAAVLWVDDNTDVADERRNKAIPARHVLGVLEVKARLNPESAKEASEKLLELKSLEGVLHANFSCGYVFFEVDPKAETKKSCLDNLMPDTPFQSFYGGVILRGTNAVPEASGWLQLAATNVPNNNLVSKDRPISLNSSGSRSVEWPSLGKRVAYGLTPNIHSGGAFHHLLLMWGLNEFTAFAFSLLHGFAGRNHHLIDSPVIVGPMGGGFPDFRLPGCHEEKPKPKKPSRTKKP